MIFSTYSDNTAYIDLDNYSSWSITTSGNANYVEEDGYASLAITGDCTINAEYIGS